MGVYNIQSIQFHVWISAGFSVTVKFWPLSFHCHCVVDTVYIPSSPLFISLPILGPLNTGPTQGLKKRLRHEAAQQVWDDQKVRVSLFLGGETHYGILQQSLDCSGVDVYYFFSLTHTVPFKSIHTPLNILVVKPKL